MSKKDQNAVEETQEPQENKTASEPANVAKLHSGISMAEFNDNSQGEIFGGSFPLLALGENEVSPLLEYSKDTQVPIEIDGKSEMKTIPVCNVVGEPELPMVSMPISAIFVRHWKDGNLSVGDQFHVARFKDAIKKRGAGKGNPMKVYGLKVMKRA